MYFSGYMYYTGLGEGVFIDTQMPLRFVKLEL